MSEPRLTVYFLCPNCESMPGHADALHTTEWQCPECDHLLKLHKPEVKTSTEGTIVSHCATCGCEDIYKRKGFPHWLGLTILTLACLGFLILMNMYETKLAWGVLLVSAAIDGILYLMVPDVVVCYRCGSVHRGMSKSGNAIFELTTQERYRQEKARKEQIAPQKEQTHSDP